MKNKENYVKTIKQSLTVISKRSIAIFTVCSSCLVVLSGLTVGHFAYVAAHPQAEKIEETPIVEIPESIKSTLEVKDKRFNGDNLEMTLVNKDTEKEFTDEIKITIGNVVLSKGDYTFYKNEGRLIIKKSIIDSNKGKPVNIEPILNDKAPAFDYMMVFNSSVPGYFIRNLSLSKNRTYTFKFVMNSCYDLESINVSHELKDEYKILAFDLNGKSFTPTSSLNADKLHIEFEKPVIAKEIYITLSVVNDAIDTGSSDGFYMIGRYPYYEQDNLLGEVPHYMHDNETGGYYYISFETMPVSRGDKNKSYIYIREGFPINRIFMVDHFDTSKIVSVDIELFKNATTGESIQYTKEGDVYHLNKPLTSGKYYIEDTIKASLPKWKLIFENN